MVDYPQAIPIFVDRSRVFIDNNDHKALVLHGTAGGSSAQNIADFFANDPNMASTHYVIGQDGAVVQCVLEVDGAAGNCCLESGHDPFWDQFQGNMNWHTLSIEHCIPDTNNALPLTDVQKQESFKLVKYLVDKYNLPLDHIKGHYSLDPQSRRDCPGPLFPWAELWAFLQEQPMPTIDLSNGAVASFFQADSPTNWRCKQTGHIIGGAILTFYKSYGPGLCGLTNLGLPLSDEIRDTPSDARVVIQHYERGDVRYDPGHVRSFPPGAGNVYIDQVSSSDTVLQAQITALQGKIEQAKKVLA